MIVKEKGDKSAKAPPAKEKSDNSSKKAGKKQKKMATNVEMKCPICCENLQFDEHCFYPCSCGYQICSFCWHRIKTNENSLCPACRRPYPDDPVNYKPLSQEELQKLKTAKKLKDIQKKKEIAESRKQFANTRVVQKNLIYVHGLPFDIEIDDNRLGKLQKIFKEFGPITKCVVNTKTNYAGTQQPKASAYVTYQKMEDALKAYKRLPNTKIEGYEIKTSLGTTKYCSNFLKNIHCPKTDCMYLHEMADEELCFTHEQIQAGEHLRCADRLYEKMVAHSQQRMVQYSQVKEALVEEKAPTPEVPSPSKEETTNIIQNSCEESRDSPVQSRLQQYLCKSEPEIPASLSNFHHLFKDPPVTELLAETSRDILSSEQGQAHLNCRASEDSFVNSSSPSVNNSHNGGVKPFQNFPLQHTSQEHLHNGELWQERNNKLLGDFSHLEQQILQQHQNIPLYDLRLHNGTDNVKSSLHSRLPYPNHGTNSLSDSFETRSEQYDDDLEFDPLQYSLNGLEDLIQAEPKVNTLPSLQRFGRAPHPNSLTPKQQHDLHLQEQERRLQLKLAHHQMLRLKNNPPPGFQQNSYPSNHHPQQSSPVYESRNPPLPSRMSPVMNTFSSLRGGGGAANYPVSRISSGAGISLNSTITNGYSPQTVRISPQNLQMHEFHSRPTQQNAQNLHSQRFENITQPQFAVEQPNLSPSFYNNMNQSQWMTTENCIQNQGISLDYRPSSPLLNLRRMPQLRPNDYNRMHQLTGRVNNLSLAADAQYLYPNSQQQQQQQGVHTFP